jgi:hypothetical protein
MKITLRQIIDDYDNDQGFVYRCFVGDDPILPWNVAGMSEEEWYDPDRSFARLEKYLISDEAFELKWRDVYNRVFTNQTLEESIRNPLAGFQSHLFAKGFVGGYIFEEDTYRSLRRCLLSIGEEEMIITGGVEGTPILHLRIPVRLTWKDICQEGYALMSILNTEDGVFKVFGPRGDWGKICVNEVNVVNGAVIDDYRILDVVGFADADLLKTYESMLPEVLLDPDSVD